MAIGININDFKTFTEFIAKKSGKGDYATPSQFNQLVNRAIVEFIARRNGNRMQYQAGRPVPNVSYEKTGDVMDDLRYLKEVREFVVTDGEFSIPDGSTVADKNGAICPEYIHWKSIRHYYYIQVAGRFVTKEYPIEVVSEAELGKRLVSSVNAPSKVFPIAQELKTSFKIYPTNIQYVVMDYLRYPVSAVWNYTEVNGRPVYASNGSVDIELPKESFNELAMMYLSFLGINMRDGELVQYSEMKSREGI
jgi:hypothetical protein